MNDIIDMVEHIISFVENNLFTQFELGSISKSAYLSKFYMLRTFKAVTGYGIIEYTNLRRLSLSLHDLLYSDNSISFIGDKYCFAGSQSYIRAFKRAFGLTPLMFRKSPSELKIHDRFNTSLIHNCGKGVIIQPEIKVVPPFCIAGIPNMINDYDNCEHSIGFKSAINFYYNRRREIKNPVNPDIYIGYSYIHETFLHEEERLRCVQYIPSLIVDHNSTIPNDMRLIEIKSQKCAVFKYIGSHSIMGFDRKMIIDLWDYIHDVWMPSVSAKPAGRHYSYEQIDPNICGENYFEMLIYVPILTV